MDRPELIARFTEEGEEGGKGGCIPVTAVAARSWEIIVEGVFMFSQYGHYAIIIRSIDAVDRSLLPDGERIMATPDAVAACRASSPRALG